MSQETIEGLFIDFYGTVADGDRATVEQVCQRLVDEHSLNVSASALAVMWGEQFFAAIERSNHDSFRTLFECECDSLVATVGPLAGLSDPVPYVEALQDYWRRPPLFEESAEVLAEIPVPVCCVSNADRHELDAALRHHGLRFEHVVTSQDARCYKPHPGVFEMAIARTGWQRERIVHVGDSLHSDIAGAGRCGMRTVWICRGNRISDIGSAQPDYAFADLRGLRDLLAPAGTPGSSRRTEANR